MLREVGGVRVVVLVGVVRAGGGEAKVVAAVVVVVEVVVEIERVSVVRDWMLTSCVVRLFVGLGVCACECVCV